MSGTFDPQAIEIITKTTSDSTLDNLDRKELLWESREEELIKGWVETIKKNKMKHRMKGMRYKRFYYALAIPCIITPLILSNVIEFLNQNIESIMMIFIGIITALNTFFNFGKRYSENFEYEGKYDELLYIIETELAKPKTSRIACDVFLERIQNKLIYLSESAPHI